MKRLLDFSASLMGLILLSPLFVIVAIIIKLDSKGPVFYLQERVGRNAKPFLLYKFRTMRVDADRAHAITVGKRDPRITSFGWFLRKFKLDELPQLINVIKGDMSLVGPRPELKKFTDLYSVEQQKVLNVRPGITDPASIQFRNENEMLEGKADPIGYYIQEIMPVKLEVNLRYLEKRSVMSDFGVVCRTLVSIFKK